MSAANNQPGPDDPRNVLFARYCTLVSTLDDIFQLDFVVFENVPGLKQKKNLRLYSRLKSSLSKKFKLHEAELNAADFGVAQNRRRLFIIGISKRLKQASFAFPEPKESIATVRDAIGGLPKPVYFKKGKKKQAGKHHPNHWTMRPMSGRFKGKKSKRDGRSFIRLKWSKPSRTVAYGHREIHMHPGGRRRLSIYEAMLLQGFSKSYELLGNLSEQVTQVSNAVPPPVAKALAQSVSATISAQT